MTYLKGTGPIQGLVTNVALQYVGTCTNYLGDQQDGSWDESKGPDGVAH